MGTEEFLHRAREAYYYLLMNAEFRTILPSAPSVNHLQTWTVPRTSWTTRQTPLHSWHRLVYIWWKELCGNLWLLLQFHCDGPAEWNHITNSFEKKQFSRHGIPDVLIGSQYFSGEYHWYAYPWKFKHVTLSPRHPQSNGKAENAVKTCKSLLKKAKLAKA